MKTLDDFKREFPTLYDHPKLFDFSPPPGWVELVWSLSEQLVSHDVQVVQVKEKFGGLRVYLDIEKMSAAPLLRTAEAVSGTMCQECGKAAQLAMRGHLIGTWCPEHMGGAQRVRETPYGFDPDPKDAA